MYRWRVCVCVMYTGLHVTKTIIRMQDVWVEGPFGVMYTDCEVYANVGVNTDVRRPV